MNIPYNCPVSGYGSYGDGLNGTLKPPIPSSWSDSQEISYQWGTTLAKLVGRAKGFGGIGTISRYGTVQIIFPVSFTIEPIVNIMCFAPVGYDKFDLFQYYYERKSVGRSLYEGRLFGNPDEIYSKNQIAHKAWERREAPLDMIVYTTTMIITHNPFRNVLFGNTSGNKEAEFDSRGESQILFSWHAIGV